MALDISAFTEVLSILKGIAEEVKKLTNLKKDEQKALQESLAATAELVDESLGLVKQEMSKIVIELRMDSADNAQRMLAALAHVPEWESKYRQFQLCDALRGSIQRLENRVFPSFFNRMLFKSPTEIISKLHEYIGGEYRAALSVAQMLDELSTLSSKLPDEKDAVLAELEKARDEVGQLRQSFIDLERQIRSSV